MKFWAYKKCGKLQPASTEDKEKVNKIAVGEPVMLKHVKVRNPKHHRLYFAFINKVYENLPESIEYTEHPETGDMVKRWPEPDNFRKQMEMYAGYYSESITLKGEVRLEPKSIKYEELDEMGFKELHKNVKRVIGERILPKMDMDLVEREIAQFYG
jgi:hypothetical protein